MQSETREKTREETTENREQRIANFNQRATEAERSHAAAYRFLTTYDFMQKSKISGGRPMLEDLSPISLADLRTGVTHRGKAIFCRIVSERIILKATTVLVEDDSGMAELAVYGLESPEDLSEGRRLAILEPFFKTRANGTEGIRVDDTSDIAFDVGPLLVIALEKQILVRKLLPKKDLERVRLLKID